MAQFTTNNHLIYVVDDDTAIARLVSVNLTARGYRVKEFDRGLQAIAGLKIDDPDLVIMDLMMPDLDGLEVTRQIRQVSQVPILILSVLGETASKLTALDLGAEDYLTKPFRIEDRGIVGSDAGHSEANRPGHKRGFLTEHLGLPIG